MPKIAYMFRFVIFFFISILYSIKINAQKVPSLDALYDFKVEEKTVKEALLLLEEKLQADIGYSNTFIEEQRTVSVNHTATRLDVILRSIFSDPSVRFQVSENRILIYRQRQEYSGSTAVLSGYVRDRQTNELVGGAAIYIPSADVGVNSNTYGFYSITVPKGQHKLWTTALGYQDFRDTLSLAENLQRDIYLSSLAEDLNEVVVVSKRQQSHLSTYGSTQINPEIVQNTPALFGEKDVLRTLQTLPGIQSGVEGSAGLIIRGGLPGQNLISIDDAPIYQATHASGLYSVFSGNVFKHISVDKGNFSAKYGGRVSSLVRLQTIEGSKDRVTGEFSIGTLSSSITAQGPLEKGKTSFVFHGRRTYLNDIFTAFEKDSIRNRENFADIQLKFHHILSNRDKLFWSTYFGQDRLSFRQITKSGVERNITQWGNITSSLRWNHQFNSRLFSNTSLIFSTYSISTSENNIELGIREEETGSGLFDYNAKIDFDYNLQRNHQFSFGFSSIYHKFTPGRFRRISENGQDIEISPDFAGIETSLYAEDLWRITPKLQTRIGLRLNTFFGSGASDLNPEPRLSLSYLLPSRWYLDASYSRMNQYVHQLSYFSIRFPLNLWVISTDRVPPQRSQNFTLGVSKKWNKTYSFSLEGYYRTIVNVPQLTEISTSIPQINDSRRSLFFDWQNRLTIGQFENYGMELLLQKESPKWSGTVGYTLAWANQKFPDIDVQGTVRLPHDRRHTISLNTIFKPSQRITLSGSWYYHSGSVFTLLNQKVKSSISDFPVFQDGQDTQETSVLTSGRNNFQGKPYHRLDLAVQFHKRKGKRKNRERIWSFSLINAYFQHNPDSYSIDSQGNALQSTSFFLFLPSVTYTCKFL